MSSHELKEKKKEFLSETLLRCIQKEPTLSLSEIADIVAFQVGKDLTEFLKKYKIRLKKQ